MSINIHPTHDQLAAYVAGSGDSAMALVIAAHCDMCEHCQQRVAQLNQQLSLQAFAESMPLSNEFQQMMAQITTLPAHKSKPASAPQATLELDGRQFPLPRALRRFANKTGSWSHLVGKLWQAPVDLDGAGKATFIYMEKGGRVPEHTHRGSELTLVLDGEFSDGVRDYDTGDFILLDSSHKHTPHSDAEEGCLVFSVVDKPLHFTSGLARMLNPFSQLFF